uniref:Caffeyl alcohol/5-hydroxyconiferyl alcohol 3/5-O-methyltransferase-like 3 n=1 Tax=Selaginella moellendorffii TaxID=88036 RepID=F6J0G9_SELML|nr:caffeyl alcohol/5-hydroxyconiferyl alcohol 3/5-O-methyltransferase-like 3 [Selaginella moellendorffii]
MAMTSPLSIHDPLFFDDDDQSIGEVRNSQFTEDEILGRMECLGMIHAFVTPFVLNAAIKLRVFDIVAHAAIPPTAEEIMAKISSSSSFAATAPAATPQLGVLRRILRFLSQRKVLRHVSRDDGHVGYALTGISTWLVRSRARSDYLAPLLAMEMHARCQASWQRLHEVVLDGGDAFDRANGNYFWDTGRHDAQFNRVVNDAMIAFSTATMSLVLESYRGFAGIRRLVDVGGGMGHSVAKIVEAYPQIQGVNYDLSHVITTAPKIQGVEHVSGDMFESVPAADAIFMQSVLHNWDDEHCVKLLNNCYRALPQDGKLIIVDIIYKSSDTFAALEANLDMIMLAYTTGGQERTPNEWEELLISCGFGGITFHTNMPTKEGVIEAYKMVELRDDEQERISRL